MISYSRNQKIISTVAESSHFKSWMATVFTTQGYVVLKTVAGKFSLLHMPFIYLFIYLLVLVFELRASCLLGRHSTT
jgi:hypothetical protein